VRVLATLLLLGVFLRHDTAFTVAEWTGWTPSGVFYVQGALWELVLCGVLAFIFLEANRSLWRSLALAACAIGMIEAALVGGCQMVIVGHPPPQMTQCDFVSGLPIFAISMLVELVAVAIIIGEWAWHQREIRHSD